MPQDNLRCCYQDRLGVTQDKVKVCEWFRGEVG